MASAKMLPLKIALEYNQYQIIVMHQLLVNNWKLALSVSVIVGPINQTINFTDPDE